MIRSGGEARLPMSQRRRPVAAALCLLGGGFGLSQIIQTIVRRRGHGNSDALTGDVFSEPAARVSMSGEAFGCRDGDKEARIFS
jgi:hypothetical protein